MNHGTAFERQLTASLYRKEGRKLAPDPPGRWVWNVPSPQHRRPEQATASGPAKVRFTPKMIADLMVLWPRWRHLSRWKLEDPEEPAVLGDPLPRPDGSHTFIAEAKSTDVPRLAFDVLWTKATEKKPAKPWQRDQLAGVAAAGAFAGVLWEWRDSRRGGWAGAVFIPIATWCHLEATLGRKSLPWAVAVRDGIVVERDLTRGTKKPYWRFADLLRTLAGEHPPRVTDADRDTLAQMEARRAEIAEEGKKIRKKLGMARRTGSRGGFSDGRA